MARQVVKEIATAIKRGCVVMIQKTKPIADGGRQLVSVGKNRKAVGESNYIVIGKRWDHQYPSAMSAARAFADFVNRDRAWEALRRARCPGD